MSLDNNLLQMGKTCNKVSIYFYTNFMVNIFTDKLSFHFKRRLKSWFVTLRLAALHFVFQSKSNLPHKRYVFLIISSSDMIVLKLHILLLYIQHQAGSKQYFLVVKVGVKVMYIFKLLKDIFWQKSQFFESFYVQLCQFSLCES